MNAQAPRAPTSRGGAALIALGIALATALLAFASVPRGARVERAPQRLPQPTLQCSAAKESARERALETEQAGSARIARYPFAAADGMAALRAFSEARDCFLLAGDVAANERVRLTAARFRDRVERDYRDHLTRYRQARSAGRPVLELGELRFLLALLSREQDPPIDALRRAQHELEAEAPAEVSR